MAKIKSIDNLKAGEDAAQELPPVGNAKWHCHFGRQSGGFLAKLNIVPPLDALIKLWGIYLNELQTYVHVTIYT